MYCKNNHVGDRNSSILNALLNILPGSVSVMDKNYTILMLNQYDQLQNIIDYEKNDEPVGQKCYEVFRHRNSPCDFCRLQEVIKNGKTVVAYENSEDAQDIRDVKSHKIIMEPIFNNNEIIGVVEYGLDISDNRNKGYELSHTRDQYVDLAEQAPVGIMTCDLEGNITYVNMRVVELMGSPSREATMKVNLLTFPLLVNIRVSEVIKKCMELNVSENIDVDYESKWGRHLWMRVSIKPIVELEKVTGARIIIDDVTELVKSHKIAKENETTFKAMVENLADAIWILDKDGIVLDVNQRVTEETWYDKKDLLGSFIGDYDPNITLDEFHKVYEETINKGYFKYVGKTYRRDGLLLDVEVNSIPFTLEGDKVLVCSSRNITEQKQYEKSILSDKEKAESANRAKSDFLANMSHEIRTPMNGILGFLQLLEMTEMNYQQLEYIDLIRSSTSILLQTINDILDVSKIEAGKFSIEYVATDLHVLIDDTIQMFRPLVEEKEIEFKVFIDENIPSIIITDPLRLKQVFNNLLSNAIKFTERGSIEFNVSVEKKTALHSIITFRVKDTGIGISNERANKLFDAFEQEDLSITRKYGGTGLGLAICKTIVSALKGQITFESTKGIGTIFKIVLPITIASNNVTSSNINQPINYEFRNHVIDPILVVEDSPVNQKFITTVLKKNGYIYDIAFNGLEAFEKAQKTKYSMILMDCQMPIMDGYTSSKKIKCLELNQLTPIIAMTAYALEGDRLKCFDSGMVDYISKPLPIEKIINIVKKYAKRKP